MSSDRQEVVISDIDPVVNVFHIGGREGGIGPTDCLLQLGRSMSLSIFEADIDNAKEDDWQGPIADYAQENNVKLSFIPECLSNYIGKKQFNVNVMPECSSLLKMSPQAEKYQRFFIDTEHRIKWGQICRPVRIVELNVTTLDKLRDDNVVGLPDFLSIDVQGAEYEVLEGASNALSENLVGVISEVEFHELYDGQKLFTDQCTLLEKHSFKVIELYNSEYWYSGPLFGKGVLTVAEVLFLRDYRYFVKKYDQPVPLLLSLAKLAIVANCFERTSYAFEIVEYIMNNWRNEWDIFVEQTDHEYLKNFTAFYKKGKALQLEMEERVPACVEYVKRIQQTAAEKA